LRTAGLRVVEGGSRRLGGAFADTPTKAIRGDPRRGREPHRSTQALLEFAERETFLRPLGSIGLDTVPVDDPGVVRAWCSTSIPRRTTCILSGGRPGSWCPAGPSPWSFQRS